MTLADDFSEGRSWPRRLISLGAVLAVLAGGAYAGWYFFLRDDSAPAKTAIPQEATATIGRLVSSLTTTGTANAITSTKVTFGTSGQVKSVSVAVGDSVTAGKELARLDDKNASRTLETASSNLTSAQLKLKQLTDPPTAADLAAARQSVASAEAAIANAQANLDKATGGPADADVATADSAILSAQNGLQNANNQVESSWTSLLSAQRNYCTTQNIQSNVCYSADIPLSNQHSTDLQAELRNPAGTASGASSVVSAISSFLQANTAYATANAGIVTAEKSLESAQAKRAALFAPPAANDLLQLQTALSGAQNGLVTAQAKLDQLIAGPKETDLALQQQSLKQSQISYQAALDGMDAIVLRAPFDGVVSAATLNIGDQASADSVTITNPGAMRIDMSVSETDLPNVKKGQYGIATFDALTGNSYLVRVMSVTTTPTVTQGVVTYPVQVQILRAADLQTDAAGLQAVSSALLSLTGATSLTGARGQGAAGQVAGAGITPGAAAGTAIAGGAAGAGRTPVAGRTPGAGTSGTPAAGGAQDRGAGQGTGGAALLLAFVNAPLPSPGMSSSVNLLTSVKENVLLLPTGAIKRQGRTQYVVVKKDDGTTENVNVAVGGSDSTNTEILTGVAEGQKVLLGATTSAGATTPAAGQSGQGGFQFVGPGGAGGNQPPGGIR